MKSQVIMQITCQANYFGAKQAMKHVVFLPLKL